MTVAKEPSGRRSVQVEVEVPGTPEEVWQAIATGPGISSWFVPTQVDGRKGGAVAASFGPGMESVSSISTWEPPRRFVAESADLGPDAPPIATEWIVETRGGGTCVVRVVHSLFASTDDWDGQLEGWEGGWYGFFRILRLYLTHFRGQSGAAFQAMGSAPGPKAAAWAALAEPLGLANAREGERRATPAGVPPLAGRVEAVGPPDFAEDVLPRLDAPAPGIAHLFAMPMDGQVILSVRLYLYGRKAATAAAENEPRWWAWLGERFPMPAVPA
jgi:uncharacterized protein YndB with AHSA1/START domain